MMRLPRIFKHLKTPSRVVHRAFPQRTWNAVESAVREAEQAHNIELRVVVEARLPLVGLLRGQTSRQRAIELFTLLRVWDTEHNSGVLIYVQFADKKIEIVADRGINAKVAQASWDGICRRMEAAFSHGQYEQGALAAIDEVTALLARHFPPSVINPNELPDRPMVL